MIRARLHIAGFLASAALLAACGHKQAASTVVAPPPVATITVAAGDGTGGIQWDGVVQAVEQAVLSAQTSGRVAELRADVDQRVPAGAVLLRLTSQDQAAAVAAARAQLAAAEAQLTDAAARFQRASELVDRKLVSRDDFDRVRAAHDSAAANRDAAQAQLAQAQQQLDYTVVRAPYAGIVAARQVELGETVAPGRSLYTLYAPHRLRLEVQVPQTDAATLRSKAAATITLPDGRDVSATELIVYPSADPQAHTTTVRVMLPALDNPPRPGQTAKVRFAGTGGPAGIWLPATAVVERGELSAAYVVGADGIVLRQLRLGSSSSGRVEVIAGLVAGERVASDPVAALQWLRERHDGTEAHHE
jgi:RND family efflux transporter MFP subunit